MIIMLIIPSHLRPTVRSVRGQGEVRARSARVHETARLFEDVTKEGRRLTFPAFLMFHTFLTFHTTFNNILSEFSTLHSNSNKQQTAERV